MKHQPIKPNIVKDGNEYALLVDFGHLSIWMNTKTGSRRSFRSEELNDLPPQNETDQHNSINDTDHLH